MSSHYWIRADRRQDREQARAGLDLPPVLATADAHRNLRGPYTAAGTLLRALGADLLQRVPELGPRHHIEILTAAPEFAGQVPPIAKTLEETGVTRVRTRFFPQLHTTRIAHGLVELLRDYCAARGGGPYTIVVDNAHHADATDREFLAVLLTRLGPEQVTVVVGTGIAELADPPGPVYFSLGEALAARTTAVDGPSAAVDLAPAGNTGLAGAFVDSDGTSDDPRHRAAYEQTPAWQRAAWHDRRAAELAAAGEPSLLLGAVPYHLERGSDPTGAGVAALREAQVYCKTRGLYHATVDLGVRASELVDPAGAPELWWDIIGDVTMPLAVSGRPAEAHAYYERLRTLTLDPELHMHIAYGIAMLYARHYQDERRDPGRARGWLNLAVTLADHLPDHKDAVFWSVFNHNGLALVDVREDRLPDAIARLDAGMARLDEELEPTEHLLHRNGLRYNRAQVHMIAGRLEDALADFTDAIDLDPNFPDNYFHRGTILARLGRPEAAIADYDRVIALTPPMPEAYYNRADTLADLGDLAGAVRDFGRVTELDPSNLDARVNRAGLLSELDDPEAAWAEVDAGLAIDPAHPQLWCLKGQLLAGRGQADAAAAALATALRHDEDLPEAYALRGQLSYDRGDLPAAIADLTRAIERDDGPELRFNRAVALQAADRFAEAVADLDEVLARVADPDARRRREDCLAAAGTGAGV
jgi:tetratricopeptide (TPR) repeat protein